MISKDFLVVSKQKFAILKNPELKFLIPPGPGQCEPIESGMEKICRKRCCQPIAIIRATLAMPQSLKTFQYPSFCSVGAGEYLVNCRLSFRNFWQVDCSDRLTKARAASQADHRNIGNNSWLAKILSGLVSWPFPWGGLGEFRCSSLCLLMRLRENLHPALTEMARASSKLRIRR